MKMQMQDSPGKAVFMAISLQKDEEYFNCLTAEEEYNDYRSERECNKTAER